MILWNHSFLFKLIDFAHFNSCYDFYIPKLSSIRLAARRWAPYLFIYLLLVLCLRANFLFPHRVFPVLRQWTRPIRSVPGDGTKGLPSARGLVISCPKGPSGAWNERCYRGILCVGGRGPAALATPPPPDEPLCPPHPNPIPTHALPQGGPGN